MTGAMHDLDEFDDLDGLHDSRIGALHDDLRALYLTDVPTATQQAHLQRIDATRLDRTTRASSETSRRRRLLAGTGVAAVVFVSGAGLAAAGVLPPAVQHRIAVLGGSLGLHLPSGGEDPADQSGVEATTTGGVAPTRPTDPPTTVATTASPPRDDDHRPDPDAQSAPEPVSGPVDPVVTADAPQIVTPPSSGPPTMRADAPPASTPTPTPPEPPARPPASNTPSSVARPTPSTPAVTRPSTPSAPPGAGNEEGDGASASS